MKPVMLLALIVLARGAVLADMPLPPREAAEEAEISRRIRAVLPKFQDAFNEEYVNLAEDGKLCLDEDLVYGHYRHWRCSGDANRVMFSLFERNPEMQKLCAGLPWERLLVKVKLPPRSAFPRQVFREWSEAQMNGADQMCRHIIFDWLFYCCEAEKRPWRVAFSGFLNKRPSRRGWQRGSGRSRFDHITEKDPPCGFEDLLFMGDVATFALKWYERALAAGYAAKEHDKLLAGRLRDGLSAKMPAVGVSGDWIRRQTGKVAGTYGTVSPFTLTIYGAPSDWELEAVASYLREWNKRRDYRNAVSHVRFIGADDQVVVKVMRTINSMKVQDRAAGVHGWDGIITLSFDKCRVRDLSFLQEGCKYECLSFQDCTIGDLSLVSNADAISRLSLLKLKSEVDLSPIRSLKSIATLDVSHTTVTNVMALSCHPTLERIVMNGAQGPFDWDSVIPTLPKLKMVEYDDSEIPAAKRTEFKRVVRRCSRNMRTSDRLRPDEELHLAVMDNDADEVARFLSSGMPAQKEWEKLLSPGIKYGCKLVSGDIDVAIVKMLLDAGATAAAMRKCNQDILWDLCAGPGSSSNCVEVMRLLLNRGCDPRKGKESPIGGIGQADPITQFHVLMVDALLDRGEEPSRAHDVLKSLSGRYSDKIDCRAELVELLLKRGKWTKKELSESLHHALLGTGFSTSRKIALALLKAGAPVPANGPSIAEDVLKASAKSIEKTDRELIRVLGGRITESPRTKRAIDLHHNFNMGVYRFRNGPSMLSKDIDDGANVNALDLGGNVPLVSLIKGIGSPFSGTNQTQLVEIMLQHGADPNLAGREGETPLVTAVERLDAKHLAEVTNVVSLLCRYDADLLIPERRCALAAAIQSAASVTSRLELVRQLMNVVKPTARIPSHVIVAFASADLGPNGTAHKKELIGQLVERGASVTDAAVCAGWWDADVRKALLSKSGKKESDYVAAKCGSACVVRAIPKPPVDEVSDRRRVENIKRHYESMLEDEHHFANQRHFGGLVDMDRRRIEDAVAELRHRRGSVLSRISPNARSAVETRISELASEESNRVAKVFALLNAATNDVSASAALKRARQDRRNAWSKVEAGLAARAVAGYQLEAMRLEYECETVRWEWMERECVGVRMRMRQHWDQAVRDLIRWLKGRLSENIFERPRGFQRRNRADSW